MLSIIRLILAQKYIFVITSRIMSATLCRVWNNLNNETSRGLHKRSPDPRRAPSEFLVSREKRNNILLFCRRKLENPPRSRRLPYGNTIHDIHNISQSLLLSLPLFLSLSLDMCICMYIYVYLFIYTCIYNVYGTHMYMYGSK